MSNEPSAPLEYVPPFVNETNYFVPEIFTKNPAPDLFELLRELSKRPELKSADQEAAKQSISNLYDQVSNCVKFFSRWTDRQTYHIGQFIDIEHELSKKDPLNHGFPKEFQFDPNNPLGKGTLVLLGPTQSTEKGGPGEAPKWNFPSKLSLETTKKAFEELQRAEQKNPFHKLALSGIEPEIVNGTLVLHMTGKELLRFCQEPSEEVNLST